MKRILIALFISATMLTGCASSVSQENYDTKVSELEKVQKELTELKKEKAQEDMSQAGAKAWVLESLEKKQNILYQIMIYTLLLILDILYQKSLLRLYGVTYNLHCHYMVITIARIQKSFRMIP